MRLARIEAELAVIDKQILAVIETDPDLRACHKILVGVAGIPEVTAGAILTLMPELGQLDRRLGRPCSRDPSVQALDAFTGLALLDIIRSNEVGSL